MYCELHCHSHYSLLDGASSPEALIDRAVALGMPALALTDHDGLYGAVAFWRAARARGIRPVIGAELTLAHGSHLTLLAENQTGYSNLSRLISVGQLAGTKGAPHLTIEDVARHAGGLLCLAGCRQGAVAAAVLADDMPRAVRAAGRLADIFGRDRVWIELQRHWLPDDAQLTAGLVAAAQQTDLPLVITNNVHYATTAEHRLRDILCATRLGCTLRELAARLPAGLANAQASIEFHLKGMAEMAALFPDLPEALAATQVIAELCDVSLDFSSRRTPAFPLQTATFAAGLPPGESSFSYLYALSHAGLAVKYRPITPRAVRQLAHELAAIEAAKLADYFLIVWDIVRYAREQDIRCQGRGSAANSLVAYVLGITPVDPLRHNLLFERFLSDRTDTMPDIDIDFASDRRDEVVAYIYERYGAEHAAMVCNVVTYQWRSAVRDVARAVGFVPEDVDRISEWAKEVRSAPESQSEGQDLPAESALVLDLATQLIDTPRHLSVHVGGMLVTAQPLVEVVPLERATKEGVVVVQWNKDSVADAGLIKIDLLCLRTLDVISEAVALIAARQGQHQSSLMDRRSSPVDELTLDDPAVYHMLAAGDTIGCFQVESRGETQMLPRLKPICFEDLIIQVSIVRPGPIMGGMVHPYLRRRQGLEPVTYLHPSLEPVLAETLGVIIFQEQVIRTAVALAGFSPGEADMLRRAMSRSRSTDAMAQLQERFMLGAAAKGVDQQVAADAFGQLRGFATYGFCKSHAAAFALVAYQTLWLKNYHPLELFCAILNHQPMGFYSPEVVIGDAQRHKITILRPDVNASRDECTCEAVAGASEGAALRLGLRYLHGLGENGRERLLTERGALPFSDLASFCRRTRLPRSLIADVIRAGAFDSLLTDRRRLLWELGGLRYVEEALIEAPDVAAELPPLAEGEALSWDYELLGLSPGDHPMRLLRDRLAARRVLTAAELAQRPAGQIVVVAGLVVVRQAPPTAKGHLFITLEDETGLINLIIRPDLHEKRRVMLHGATFLLAKGLTQALTQAQQSRPQGAGQHEGATNSVLVQEITTLEDGMTATRNKSQPGIVQNVQASRTKEAFHER